MVAPSHLRLLLIAAGVVAALDCEEGACGQDSGALLQLPSRHVRQNHTDTHNRSSGTGAALTSWTPQQSTDEGCIWANSDFPCYHWHNGTSYDPGAWALVQELNIALPRNVSQQPVVGSTHEITQQNVSQNAGAAQSNPIDTIWVTNQHNSYITRMQYPAFELTTNVTYFIPPNSQDLNITRFFLSELPTSAVKESLSEGVLAQGGLDNAGLHKLLFSRKQPHMAFMALQFMDAIGILDTHLMRISHIWHFPCRVFNLTRKEDSDAHPKRVWDCAGPHDITEDSQGNLWIAMKKSGGLAALHRPLEFKTGHQQWHRRWYYYQLPPKNMSGSASEPLTEALPFAIASGPLPAGGADVVYINSITTAAVYVMTFDGNWPPQHSRWNPREVDVSIASREFPCDAKYDLSNPRPGLLDMLPNGDVLATAYNSVGMLLYISSRGEFQPLDLPRSFKHSAFLAMCSQGSRPPFDDSLLDLKLLSSSNDFEKMSYLPADISPPTQPDLLVVLAATHPVRDFEQKCFSIESEAECKSKGGSCYWSRIPTKSRFEKKGHYSCRALLQLQREVSYAAPTQDSWLHRVHCESPPPFSHTDRRHDSLTFVSELVTDRIFIVHESSLSVRNGIP